MTKAMHIGSGSGNKSARPHLGAPGNKACKAGFIGTSGGNKQFFAGEQIVATNQHLADNGTTPSVSSRYRATTTGTVLRFVTTYVEDWLDPVSSAPGAYQIKATLSSGDSPSGSALSTWLDLSTQRDWTLLANAEFPFKSCTLSIEYGVGGVTQKTVTVYLEAWKTA